MFKFEIGDRVSPLSSALTKGTVYSQITTRDSDGETFEYEIMWDFGPSSSGWSDEILKAASE